MIPCLVGSIAFSIPKSGLLRMGGRVLVLLNILLIFQEVSCQPNEIKQATRQVSLQSDNNFFLLKGKDGYYTNGLFVKYNRLRGKTSERAEKQILSFELGQMIFTAHSRKILPTANPQLNITGGIDQIDRPIAGYLFGKISRTSFYKNHTLMEWGASVGTIGKNSLAQSTQEFWHKVIGVKDHWNWVWDYQVNNELGVNLHGTYALTLLNRNQFSFIQLTPITKATVGSIFTDVSQSVLLQMGKLRPMHSSSFWSSRLQGKEGSNTDKALELFIFYRPEVKYALYNATIQGGLFKQDKGPILSDVKSVVLSHELGAQVSSPGFSLRYSVILQSREAKSQFFNQSFASIVCSISF